jgi:dipeptidyl aminopeptidase/acylaminoacyl peptidase
LIAGGINESIFQPEWSPDGVLYFVSDRSGWWNLYRRWAGQDESLLELEAEFAVPQWLFGISTYGFVSDRNIACTYERQGVSHLAMLDLDSGLLDPVETPYDDIRGLRVAPERVVFNAASSTKPRSVIEVTLPDRQVAVLRSSSEVTINENYLSRPKAIEFSTEGGLTAHAFYYAPRNKDYQAPAGERPPLLVMSHGGPTASTTTALNLGIHYWTSRGFAMLDVNYGGSTGYGRAYRERLKGQWGIVDVDDCINGACYLVEKGFADGNRLAIRGASAGGYTTLCALTFRNVFQVGASYFGVSDLEALAKETHKFESRYLDSMVGPYPEKIDLYRERSPIYHVDRFSAAIILLQGLEDKVVPPSQAELMLEAVRAKGLPVAYVPFEGEQHGFRKAENMKRALEAELYFYGKVLGFDIADQIDAVAIENI